MERIPMGPVATLTVPIDKKELQREIDGIIGWNKDLIYLWAMDVPMSAILGADNKPSMTETMNLMWKHELYEDAIQTLLHKQPYLDATLRELSETQIIQGLTEYAMARIIEEDEHNA